MTSMCIPTTPKFAEIAKTKMVDLEHVGHTTTTKLAGNGMHVAAIAAIILCSALFVKIK